MVKSCLQISQRGFPTCWTPHTARSGFCAFSFCGRGSKDPRPAISTAVSCLPSSSPDHRVGDLQVAAPLRPAPFCELRTHGLMRRALIRPDSDLHMRRFPAAAKTSKLAQTRAATAQAKGSRIPPGHKQHPNCYPRSKFNRRRRREPPCPLRFAAQPKPTCP